MPAKRLPETNEERLKALNTIVVQEELEGEDSTALSLSELHELRNFLLIYEGACFCFKQALNDEIKAEQICDDLFKTAQLYIIHFIRVLYMAIERKEIKEETKAYYGLEEGGAFAKLSAEEILFWGERLIKGEAERMAFGGTPIYNPTISKVKVHFDLFKDAFYQLKIYRKNTIRTGSLEDLQEKAERMIWDSWTRVEFKYWELPEEVRRQKCKDYGILFHYQEGE